MSTRTRRVATTPESVLNAVAQAAAGMKKTTTERRNGEIHIASKSLLSKQSLTAYIEGHSLIFTAKDDMNLGLSWKIIDQIEDVLSDQGWAEARSESGKMIGESAVRSRCLEAIDTDETVTGVAVGYVGKEPVYLLSTDRSVRVLYVKAVGAGDQVIPLSKISSVESQSGMVNASVKIITSNADIEVEKMAERHGRAVAAAVKRSISGAVDRSAEPAAPTNSGIGQIAQLAELHASGALTDEEFAAAKSKALGL